MTRPEIYRALAYGKQIEGHTYVGKWELLDEREVIEWINGDLDTDSFKESDFRLAQAAPKPTVRMVPLDDVLDIINEAAEDTRRDLEQRAEKEAV